MGDMFATCSHLPCWIQRSVGCGPLRSPNRLHHHVCRRVTCAELHANVSSYLRRLMHRGVSSVTASSISSVESCRWPGAKSRVRPQEGLLGQNQISVYLSTLWNTEWAKLYVGFGKLGGLSFPNSWRKLVKWYTCDENKCGSVSQDDVPSILSLISWVQLLIWHA